MSAATTVVLDTQAPRIFFSAPVRLPDGRLSVPYRLDEPALVAADIDRVVAVIGDLELVTSASLPQAGELRIRAHVRDSVGNAAVREATLAIPAVGGRITKQAAGAPSATTGPTAARPSSGTAERPQSPTVRRPEEGSA